MQQNRNRTIEAIREALASTALVPGFADQFQSEKQVTELMFLLERAVAAPSTTLEAACNDLLGMVVPILAQRRNASADSVMFGEIRKQLYPNIHRMRGFKTAEDLQQDFQLFQMAIVYLADGPQLGYSPEARQAFTLAASIGSTQWVDAPIQGTNETLRTECATFDRAQLAEFVIKLERQSPATDEARRLQKENDELRRRVGELEAARIAYANEFPLTADGEPDVGNVHANIRKLKAEMASVN